MPSPPLIVAVTATFRRPGELATLAASIGALTLPLRAWIVVDNAGDVDQAVVAKAARTEVVVIRPGENLGCGAALRLAEERAFKLFATEMTHVWILDDDAVVAPDSVAVLVQTMETEGAILAYPMVTDAQGKIDWVPGLDDRSKLLALNQPHTPAEYLARFGPGPLCFSWAQGIALLVTRQGMEEHGLHRADYWVRGEDLEFALRLTHYGRGIFVPSARVAHLPPGSVVERATSPQEYAKHLALLQNVAYTGLRLPHGRRIARTIPGNYFRFAQAWGWKLSVWRDMALAFWTGAILGQPAGFKHS